MFEANEDHLREAYEKYGEVTKAVVARDARGLSRGYVMTQLLQGMESGVAFPYLLTLALPQIRICVVHR